MKLLQNKPTAILIMIVMILAGTLIGSHNSLARLSNKAESVFYSGVNNDGLCIQSDLDKRSELARNLVAVSSSYLLQDSTALTLVSSARDQLEAASTIQEKSEANKALEEAVFNLYSLLDKEGITKKEELINNFSKNPTRIYTDFRSFGDTINHDEYNDYAKEFNEVLTGFPSNMLSKLTFIKPLELFK